MNNISKSFSCHGEHTISASLRTLLSLLASEKMIDESWAKVHEKLQGFKSEGDERMSYCENHKREKIWKEKTGYGYDIYCPECRKEGIDSE